MTVAMKMECIRFFQKELTAKERALETIKRKSNVSDTEVANLEKKIGYFRVAIDSIKKANEYFMDE